MARLTSCKDGAACLESKITHQSHTAEFGHKRDRQGLKKDGLPFEGNLVPLLGPASVWELAGTREPAGLTGTPSSYDNGVITGSLVNVHNLKGHVGIHVWLEGRKSLVRKFWSALEWEHALVKGLGLAAAPRALRWQRHAQVPPDGHFGRGVRFHVCLHPFSLNGRAKQHDINKNSKIT